MSRPVKIRTGSKVKVKSGLHRSILEKRLGESVRPLEYKLKLKGRILIQGDPRNTLGRYPGGGIKITAKLRQALVVLNVLTQAVQTELEVSM